MLASVVLLDLAIYLQHVMFHAVPVFWRLHMVHHADLDVDVTTGLRFHTIEIVLSFGRRTTALSAGCWRLSDCSQEPKLRPVMVGEGFRVCILGGGPSADGLDEFDG